MTHLSNSAFVHGQVAILPPYLVAQMHIFFGSKIISLDGYIICSCSIHKFSWLKNNNLLCVDAQPIC